MSVADHIRGLRFGPLGPRSVHLCVDMQRLFDHDSPWASAAVQAALPAVEEICIRKPRATVFTRFICPNDPHSVSGQWATFYAACPAITRLDPRLFDIIPQLKPFTAEADMVTRSAFSAFHGSNLHSLLKQRRISTVIFSGVETDVCVLVTALQAIDIGYRVVMVDDAMASSNQLGHTAALSGIFPRFDQQVELVGVAELLSSWP
jgi:nicotinamidase-related amidase